MFKLSTIHYPLSTILLLFSLSVSAFDATPLVQFCAAAPSASGNWWDGLGLTELWTMDEGTGTNVYGRVGSVNSAFVLSPVWSATGGAGCVFVSVAGYLSPGDVLDLGTNASAFGCWVFTTNATPSGAGLLSKNYNSNYGLYLYLSTATKPALFMRNAAGSPTVNLTAPSAISLNEWHHIAAVRQINNGGSHLMVDGAVVLSTTNSLDGVNFNTSQSWQFGSGASTFNGYMGAISFKIGNATTNGVSDFYNASKSRYGK